jgi:hypothetical protein
MVLICPPQPAEQVNQANKRSLTVSAQFKNSLQFLMERMTACKYDLLRSAIIACYPTVCALLAQPPLCALHQAQHHEGSAYVHI